MSPTPNWSSIRMKTPDRKSLHQRLRAEAERDAEDAGAGQQRPEVDPDLAEDHEAGDHVDDDGHERAQHRGERLDALLGAQRVLGGAQQRLGRRGPQGAEALLHRPRLQRAQGALHPPPRDPVDHERQDHDQRGS